MEFLSPVFSNVMLVIRAEIMSPSEGVNEHIVFGMDPVGVSGVWVAFCQRSNL